MVKTDVFMFTTESNLQVLSEANTLYCDRTFSVCQHLFFSYSLFTASVMVNRSCLFTSYSQTSLGRPTMSAVALNKLSISVNLHNLHGRQNKIRQNGSRQNGNGIRRTGTNLNKQHYARGGTNK